MLGHHARSQIVLYARWREVIFGIGDMHNFDCKIFSAWWLNGSALDFLIRLFFLVTLVVKKVFASSFFEHPSGNHHFQRFVYVNPDVHV